MRLPTPATARLARLARMLRPSRRGVARPLVTAREAGLVRCEACGQLARWRRTPARARTRCPRCAAAVHPRRPRAIARTWSCVVAAAVLYVPANLLPVMTVTTFGAGEPDTILSGVRTLFATGQPGIALLVLFASLVVPLVKLLGLAWLLLSVQLRWAWRPRDRTRLYRVIEVIGRWSMLDLFMLAVLVALVKLEAIATIEAGAGAVAFGAVVVLTMLAAASFDPRLVWDGLEEDA